MSLPTARVSPGRLEAAYHAEIERLTSVGAMQMMWSKQPGLWKSDAEHTGVITNRLGWIGVAEAMRTFLAQALGDLESLVRRGKPALRLRLTKGPEAGLAGLQRVVEQALAGPRPVVQ